MIDFKEVFNRCLYRIKYSMTNQFQTDMLMNGVNYSEEIKHQISSEISKKMLENDKIKIIEFDFLNNLEFHAELFVCDHKKIYMRFFIHLINYQRIIEMVLSNGYLIMMKNTKIKLEVII